MQRSSQSISRWAKVMVGTSLLALSPVAMLAAAGAAEAASASGSTTTTSVAANSSAPSSTTSSKPARNHSKKKLKLSGVSSLPDAGNLGNCGHGPGTKCYDPAGTNIIVSPYQGLSNGQQVTVTGSGFATNQSVGAEMCAASVNGNNDCDLSTAETTHVGASGTFTMTFTITASITTKDQGSIDCNATGNCSVGAASFATTGPIPGCPCANEDIGVGAVTTTTTTTVPGSTSTTAPGSTTTTGSSGGTTASSTTGSSTTGSTGATGAGSGSATGDSGSTSSGNLANTGADTTLPLVLALSMIAGGLALVGSTTLVRRRRPQSPHRA